MCAEYPQLNLECVMMTMIYTGVVQWIRWQIKVLVRFEHVLARTLPANIVSKDYAKCLENHHLVLLLNIATLLVEGCRTLVNIGKSL